MIVALVLPAGAGAATSSYPPDANSQSFITSGGGWGGSTSESGLCLEMANCPAVSNTYRNQGGTLGATDGHLRTSITSLTGVGGESRGVWQSPGFSYQGFNGQAPVSVGFTLARRSDLAALLSVAGNEADTSVDLVDLSAGGNAVRIVNNLAIQVTDSWVRISTVNVSPADLVIGHNYAIRITSRFSYGAEVLPGGRVDYDDVILFASNQPFGVDAPPGGAGAGGAGGLFGGGAIFDGRNLFFKLKCLGVQKNGKCRVRATALTKKRGGKRLTFPVQRKVKAKKGKIVRARVRQQFRDELERRNKILLRSKITTGPRKNPDKEKTKFKKLKLIHRGD